MLLIESSLVMSVATIRDNDPPFLQFRNQSSPVLYPKSRTCPACQIMSLALFNLYITSSRSIKQRKAVCFLLFTGWS